MKQRPSRGYGVLAIIAALLIVVAICSNHEKEIKEWVAQRGETCLEVKASIFSNGPFIYLKNARVYRVTTDKGVYWFRFCFTREIYREIAEDDYTQIE